MDEIVFDLLELRRADSMEFDDAVLHAALYYASIGIPVVPLETGAKKLVGGNSGINYQSASKKPETIKKWFGTSGKYRGHNVGLACGMDGGIMALDIDAKSIEGTTGIKELARITSKEGALPLGPCQATPSGGFHYIYQWQTNAASSSSKVANGIDTRGGLADRSSGHIVAYPSVVGGKVYTWIEGGEVPIMPSWLSDSLGRPWRERRPEDGAAVRVEVPVHQISRMLTILDPDNLSYEDWVRVGMALKSTCGDDGLEIWDNWSEHGSRRKAGECAFRWKSFSDEGAVGFGTLLFMAKEAGWRPLSGDVSTGGGNDAEIEERVLQMNKKYAIVRMNKSLMIATFTSNSNGVKVGFLGIQSFQTIAAPDKIVVPTSRGFSERPMADIWIASPQRREYFDVGIYPNGDEPTGTLNMWNGWGVLPDSKASCIKYLEHMQHIICAGDVEIYEWLLDWMADVVQDSRNLKGSCVVLRGVEGCGKGAWADTFGQLLGKHYTHIIDSERMTTKFNALTAESILVFADEVLWPGDRKAANILKGMVTEKRVVREAKGVDSVEMDSLMHVVIASNEDWIVPAGAESRRWLVLNVSKAVAKNKGYFDALFKELNSGGKEALLYLLLNRKVTRNLRTAPDTIGLQEQRGMSHSHDSMLHFFSEILARGGFLAMDVEAKMGDDLKWPNKLSVFELFTEYRTYCRDNRVAIYDTYPMLVFIKKIDNFGFIVTEKTTTVPTAPQLKAILDARQGISIKEIKNE